jgi:putative endonuclease
LRQESRLSQSRRRRAPLQCDCCYGVEEFFLTKEGIIKMKRIVFKPTAMVNLKELKHYQKDFYFYNMKYMYVYILECADGSFYTGVTNKSERRLLEYKEGINKDSYTYSRRPLKMIYCEYLIDPNQAIIWEKRIKKWSRRKKEALISKEWKSLVEFSKRYKTFSTEK